MATVPWNFPIAYGEPKSTRTDPAPADSPMIVTRFASTPKVAIVFAVHFYIVSLDYRQRQNHGEISSRPYI